MTKTLDDEARVALFEALRGAFFDPSSLAKAVWLRTGVDLRDYLHLGGPRQDAFISAIQLAEGQGWVDRLVLASINASPASEPLQAVARSLGVKLSDAGAGEQRFFWPPKDPVVFLRAFDLERVAQGLVPPWLIENLDAAHFGRAECLATIEMANQRLHEAGPIEGIEVTIPRNRLPATDPSYPFWREAVDLALSRGARGLMALLVASPPQATRAATKEIGIIAEKHAKIFL